jgi:hypothetical protein
MTTPISARRPDARAAALSFEALLLRLDPPEAPNVAPLRPDCAMTPASAEAAFVAWRLSLAPEADPAPAARAALLRVDRGPLNGPARARLCRYLCEAALGG